MNYRHAFHAGNFADCFKHALLVWLLGALMRKPTALFVLDTHAGAGAYELEQGSLARSREGGGVRAPADVRTNRPGALLIPNLSLGERGGRGDVSPAQRTGEWRHGITRLLDDPPAPLADYVELVRRLGLYPGSPSIVRALLRPEDRLACCELHPEEHAALRQRFARDPQVAVHRRDGWEALGALLPPAERRGLVLIDPPYEAPGELDRLADGLRAGWARFRQGTFAAWYPIKHRTPVRAFFAAIDARGLRDVVAVELWLREPLDPTRLNGCGLLVVNPPWRFEADAARILPALLDRLGTRETGEGSAIIRLVDE
jgi:23S rRNA (adenine2030-N6)-methyltransferase